MATHIEKNNQKQSIKQSIMPNILNLSPRVVLSVVLILLIMRWIAVYLSSIPISVDEAQYWLWSQNFDFGYYSKPPLIAWIIGVSACLVRIAGLFVCRLPPSMSRPVWCWAG